MKKKMRQSKSGCSFPAEKSFPLIGITGGISSGKSTASKFFGELGAVVLDADITGRIVLDEDKTLLKSLEDEFGSDIIDQSGELNRKKLAEIAFKTVVFGVNGYLPGLVTSPEMVKC